MTPASGAPALGSQPVAHAASRGYNVAIGYLRGFFHPRARPSFRRRLFLGRADLAGAAAQNPDAVASVPGGGPHAHSALMTLFVSFNDTFFMALMLFVSGLFVWPSLMRKETRPSCAIV
jgi:hypothetical protein